MGEDGSFPLEIKEQNLMVILFSIWMQYNGVSYFIGCKKMIYGIFQRLMED